MFPPSKLVPCMIEAGMVTSPDTEIYICSYLENRCVSAGPWKPCYRWLLFWVYVPGPWQRALEASVRSVWACPVLAPASSKAHGRARLSPSALLVSPRGKHISGRVNHCPAVRSEEKTYEKQPCEHQSESRWRGGGAPGTQ